jgi:hypothetical protein
MLPDSPHARDVPQGIIAGGAAMPDSEPSLDLTQVLERFPGRAALVAHLASHNETFRSLCEDFALARSTLTRLSALAEADRNASVISDYESVLAELENDITKAIEHATAVD